MGSNPFPRKLFRGSGRSTPHVAREEYAGTPSRCYVRQRPFRAGPVSDRSLIYLASVSDEDVSGAKPVSPKIGVPAAKSRKMSATVLAEPVVDREDSASVRRQVNRTDLEHWPTLISPRQLTQEHRHIQLAAFFELWSSRFSQRGNAKLGQQAEEIAAQLFRFTDARMNPDRFYRDVSKSGRFGRADEFHSNPAYLSDPVRVLTHSISLKATSEGRLDALMSRYRSDQWESTQTRAVLIRRGESSETHQRPFADTLDAANTHPFNGCCAPQRRRDRSRQSGDGSQNTIDEKIHCRASVERNDPLGFRGDSDEAEGIVPQHDHLIVRRQNIAFGERHHLPQEIQHDAEIESPPVDSVTQTRSAPSVNDTCSATISEIDLLRAEELEQQSCVSWTDGDRVARKRPPHTIASRIRDSGANDGRGDTSRLAGLTASNDAQAHQNTKGHHCSVGEFYGRESLSELDEFKDPAPASIGSFSVLSSLEYGEANDFGVPETANELVNSFAADLRKIAELNASVAAMGRVSHDET